jgi:tetratricopeptide (TPR) repeat protein
LDVAGSAARGSAIRTVVVAILIFPLWTFGQNTAPGPEYKDHIRQLFEQSRWQEIVQTIQARPTGDADLDYYYGSALGQLGRWDDARRTLLAGYQIAPQDKRFPIELAGVVFKQQRYDEATGWLRRALRMDPADSYANDFLGTVYFLQGNLDAALKYWNRVHKPQIESVKTDHPLQIRPALLDRALTFAPGEQLRVADLLTSRARVESLGIFISPDFRIAARDDGKFDIVMNLAERNGFGNNKWAALLSTFSGVAYQTIYPEYFNIGHDAINFRSLLRWDAQERRAAVEVSGPLRGNPKRNFSMGIDLRNENWAMRSSFAGVAPVLGALNLRREVAKAQIRTIETGRWQWSTGMELSHRDYRSVQLGTTLTPQLLMQGMQLKALASTNYELWRVPEKRLVTQTDASWQLARIWSDNGRAYSKFDGSILTRQVRSGGAAGPLPFDELYMLGLERDNDLWMRAHIGTRDGIKGNAPLGTRYFLSNLDFDKNVYGNGLLTLKLAPFLDTGKISGISQLGAGKWLWDTGVALKIRVLGVGLAFTWGRDLRTGNNAWYFTSGR